MGQEELVLNGKRGRPRGRPKGVGSPTVRQLRLAVGLLEQPRTGKSNRQIAVEAGYGDYADPAQAIRHLKRSPNFHALMRMAAEDNGLTPEVIISGLSEGLDATTTHTATYGGRITDSRQYPDFVARLAYLRLALQLLGLEQPPKANNKADHVERPDEGADWSAIKPNGLKRSDEEVLRHLRERRPGNRN